MKTLQKIGTIGFALFWVGVSYFCFIHSDYGQNPLMVAASVLSLLGSAISLGILWPHEPAPEDPDDFPGCRFCRSKFDKARTSHYCTRGTDEAERLWRENKKLKARIAELEPADE